MMTNETCQTCTNWVPKSDPAMAKHRFARCELKPRWIYTAPQHGCGSHKQASQDVCAARVKWIKGDAMSQTIVLPWPDNKLSPNARVHYMASYRAKKAYKEACFWQAMEQGVKASNAEKLHIGLLFYKPSKRRMDIDNIFGRMKAGLDGLASALKVDDSKFKISMDFADEIGGFVRVTIEEVAA